MNIEATIRAYLPQVIHLSLATCRNNKPWVCEVHFAYDDDLNLYFVSTPARRHSQEIAANPNVAGNIVTQHDLGEAVRGVYFEGAAKQLADADENGPVFKLYDQRFDKGAWLKQEFQSATGHRLYQITVSNFYLFDGRDSMPATKHHLPWGKARA